jgi:hypothetical protein
MADLVADWAHSIGEELRIGSGIFASSVLVALVNVEVVIAEGFQILSEPASVDQDRALVDRHVIRGPTPPA